MIDLDKQIWRFYGNIFIFFKIKNLHLNTKNVPKQQFLHYIDFFKNHRGGLGRTLKIYSDILETLLKLPANWSWEQCLILTNKFDDFMGTFSFFSKLKIFNTKNVPKKIFTLQWLLQKSPRKDLVEHWKFTQIFLKHYWSFLQIEVENNAWSWQTNLTILWEHFHFFQNKKSNTKNVPKQQFLHYIDFFKNYRGRLGRTLKIDSDILEHYWSFLQIELENNDWSWQTNLTILWEHFHFFQNKKSSTQKMFQNNNFYITVTSSKITEEDLVEHWKFTQIFLKHYWSFLQIEVENNAWSWQTNLTILWEHFHFFQNKKSLTQKMFQNNNFYITVTSSKITEEDLVEHWKLTQIFLKHYWSFLQIELENNDWSWQTNLTILWEHFHFFQN